MTKLLSHVSNSKRDNVSASPVLEHIYGKGVSPSKGEADAITQVAWFQQFAKEIGINYTIAMGTALSCRRHPEFLRIPYDHDLDFFVDADSATRIGKLALDENEPRVVLAKDLAINHNVTGLVVQSDFQKAMKERNRYNCNGKLVTAQVDKCAFKAPLARILHSGPRIDLWDRVYKDHHYLASDSMPASFKDRRKITCGGLELYALEKHEEDEMFRQQYGENFLAPKRIFKGNEWISVAEKDRKRFN